MRIAAVSRFAGDTETMGPGVRRDDEEGMAIGGGKGANPPRPDPQ
jgi:hypothetical protein